MKALVCLVLGCVWSAAAEDHAFFESRIRPLLVEHCYDCHSGAKTKAGLALDSKAGWEKGGDSGPAIVPGKPEESLLIKAVSYHDKDLAMPPEKKGGKLPEAAIAALTQWVKLGAPDPRVAAVKLGGMKADEAKTWWAFQPLPKADAAPSPARIDGFIQRELEAHSINPSAAADKRTLIRRATYDLTGLPPTPDEVEAFVADVSPDAFAKVVERLLASPQYGVQWGRHWLDVVRYADTAGENTDRPLPHAWRYRNWVFDAFNRDLRYDEFIRHQIAGDILFDKADTKQRGEGIVATGYLAIARRFGHDIDKDIHLMHEDVIDNFGKNFLGLTTGCARCHDHKYDPITAADYYALYGIFNSSRFAFPGCEPKGQPRDMVPLIAQSEADALMKPWQARAAKAEAAKKERAESVSAATKTISTQAKQATRTLAAAQVNEGASVSFADGKRESLDRYDQLDDMLSTTGQAFLGLTIGCARCHDHKFEPLSTRDYYSLMAVFSPLERPRNGRTEQTVNIAGLEAYVWQESSKKPAESHVLVRGSPSRPGELVRPAVPAILVKEQPPFPHPGSKTTQRRLGLAQWIASDSNPLTARVMVNRVWQQHFGQGLVTRANDFGLMGAAPSNPELLDWLAHWFTHDAKWSLKKLHQLILSSSTWQSAKSTDSLQRYRRLEVEAIRDSMLAVSGQLNPKRFGPAMKPHIPAAALEANTDKEKVWQPSAEPEASRRSIYAFIKRGLVVPMFETLDLADTVSSCPQRQVTTVAPQALSLFNGDFVNRQAKHFAERLRREAGTEPTEQVALAWHLALCREPRSAEQAAMLEFLKQEPLEQFCRVVLNLNEFVYSE